MNMNNKVLEELVLIANMKGIAEDNGDVIKADKINNAMKKFVDDVFPSGSGFDIGTALVSATPKKIILATEFHHMNDCGYYTHWTDHRIIITPPTTICGVYNMRITGRNHNEIKEIIAELFADCLDMRMDDVRMPDAYRGKYFNAVTCSWQARK